MTAREKAGNSELYRLILAYDNFTNLFCESVNVIGHSEMICGNDALSKQDVQGGDVSSYSYSYSYSCSCSNTGSDNLRSLVLPRLSIHFRAGVTNDAPGLPAVAPVKAGGRALPGADWSRAGEG